MKNTKKQNTRLPYQPEQYAYSVSWSEEDQAFLARVAEFDSLLADGSTPQAALAEITEVVRGALELLAEEGREIPAPLSKQRFSGRLSLRLPPHAHRQLAAEAARLHLSLNQLISFKLGITPGS